MRKQRITIDQECLTVILSFYVIVRLQCGYLVTSVRQTYRNYSLGDGTQH